MGVPQGSVSSALLFLVFINDLLKLNINRNISAFAGDIGLFYSNKNVNIMRKIINTDLLLLRKWWMINNIQVNVSKTK